MPQARHAGGSANKLNSIRVPAAEIAKAAVQAAGGPP